MSLDWSRLSHAYGEASDIPGHLETLRNGDESDRARVWSHLETTMVHRGGEAPSASALRGSRFSATPPAVQAVCELLAYQHPDDEQIVGFLLHALTGGEFTLRAGPHYKTARGRIRQWGRDEPHRLKRPQSTWVGAVYRHIANALPFLVELAQDPWPDIAHDLARLLALFAANDASAHSALRQLWAHEDPTVSASAVFGLSFMGDSAAVVQALESQVVAVRTVAILTGVRTNCVPAAYALELLGGLYGYPFGLRFLNSFVQREVAAALSGASGTVEDRLDWTAALGWSGGPIGRPLAAELFRSRPATWTAEQLRLIHIALHGGPTSMLFNALGRVSIPAHDDALKAYLAHPDEPLDQLIPQVEAELRARQVAARIAVQTAALATRQAEERNIDAEIHSTLLKAATARARGEWARAERVAFAVVDRHPKLADAWVALALAYIGKGSRMEVEDALHAALRYDPDHAEGQALIAALEGTAHPVTARDIWPDLPILAQNALKRTRT